MSNKPSIRIILSIIICEAAGGIGSFFTIPSIGGWYADLLKPSFNPPNWIFGPVWTTLFALMGISLYLVWQREGPSKRFALSLFTLQLALNVLWSAIFFGFHALSFASAEIILLWAVIFWTIIAFWKISKTATYLLIPYFLWVGFATALTLLIWILN